MVFADLDLKIAPTDLSSFDDFSLYTAPADTPLDYTNLDAATENHTSSSVPEPATICILGAGLLVMIKLRRPRPLVHP